MSYSERRSVVDEMHSLTKMLRDRHQEIKSEVKRNGDETRETRNVMNRLNDRLDMLETRYNRPPVDNFSHIDSSEHVKAFSDYLRTGNDHEIKSITMNETVDTEGGYLVPPEYANFIIESLVQFSPVRRYARVIKVTSKQFRMPVQQQAQNLQTGQPAQGLFQTGWTTDIGPVNSTNAGEISMKTIPSNDLYALPYASQDMLEDASFNVEGYIQENLAKSIAFAEGTAFVNGSGVGMPMGILNAASVAQINAANPTVLPTTGAQYSIGTSPNYLIDMMYELPDYYARNATWFMNRQTIRTVREWVDGNGQYLWTPVYGQAVHDGAPALILDRPYAECIDFPAPTNGLYGTNLAANPVALGDWYAGYVVTDRIGIRVLRDPYSVKPFVLFYTTMRVGGEVVLPEAIVLGGVKQS